MIIGKTTCLFQTAYFTDFINIKQRVFEQSEDT